MGGAAEQQSLFRVESHGESSKTMLTRVFSQRTAANVQRKTNTRSNQTTIRTIFE
jgi:hypothetical protein